jgi:DNA-binding response OmpR family regulator
MTTWPSRFTSPELVLLIRSLARRQPSARARVLQAAGLELDPLRRTAVRDGRTTPDVGYRIASEPAPEPGSGR